MKVKCIDNSGGYPAANLDLSIGGIYEVDRVAVSGDYVLKGLVNSYRKSRFVVLSAMKRVKCIDSSGVTGQLAYGEVYDVKEDFGASLLLHGVPDFSWAKERFIEVEDQSAVATLDPYCKCGINRIDCTYHNV